MVKRKERTQCLIFCKKKFPNRWSVKEWVKNNGFKVDKRLRHPIFDTRDGFFRVIQRNSDYFNKKTFKEKKLCNGVKGVKGLLKI